MLKTPLFICYLFVLLSSNSQTPQLQWAKQIGGKGDDFSCGIAADASGNTYSTASFKNTVDLDPGPGTYYLTTHGFLSHPDNQDIYVTKLDANGNFIWAVQVGDTLDEGYSELVINKAGEIYVKSYFKGTLDVDPGTGVYNLTSTGGSAFLLKLSTDGNFIWARKITGSNMALDANGDIYITGAFNGMVDFDPGSTVFNLTSNGFSDICVSKFDASGNFIWAKGMGGFNDDNGHSITLDLNGNIYITGQFRQTVDFDPGIGKFNLTATNQNVFILKLDNSGNFKWARNMGPRDAWAIWLPMVVDGSGNVYTSSWFKGTVDFDPDTTKTFNLKSEAPSDWDIYISKLDSSGKFTWAKRIGGKRLDYASSLALDASQNIYIAGQFEGLVDFDPDTGVFDVTSIYPDVYILKLNPSGDFIWVRHTSGQLQMGGSGAHEALVTLDASDNIYCSGFFKGKVDFNPGSDSFNIKSNGTYDIFILKLGSATSDIKNKQQLNEFAIYPNPTNGILNITIPNPTKNILLELYNQLGVLVYSGEINESRTIDISNLPEGLYIIKVIEGHQVATRKIIKQ